MDQLAKGMLAVWMNVPPAQQTDFDEWYNREHIAERLNVPGFLSGCRYEAVEGGPRFMALYGTADSVVLTSAAYRHLVEHPTPWTQRVVSNFRDSVRMVCDVLAERGNGTGGMVRSLRMVPASSNRALLRNSLQGPVLDELMRLPGVTRVRAVEASEIGAAAPGAELHEPDRRACFLLLIEGTEADALHAAEAKTFPPSRLAALGAEPMPIVGTYRLMYGLAR